MSYARYAGVLVPAVFLLAGCSGASPEDTGAADLGTDDAGASGVASEGEPEAAQATFKHNFFVQSSWQFNTWKGPDYHVPNQVKICFHVTDDFYAQGAELSLNSSDGKHRLYDAKHGAWAIPGHHNPNWNPCSGWIGWKGGEVQPWVTVFGNWIGNDVSISGSYEIWTR